MLSRYKKSRLFARIMIMLVMVFTLALPPRPAYALFGIDDAIFNALGAMELPVKIANNIASSVMISVKAYFFTIMEAIKADGKFKQAKAEEKVRQYIAVQAMQAGLLIESTPSPLRTTCRAATSAKKTNRSRAESQAFAGDDAAFGAAEMMGLRWPSGRAPVIVGGFASTGGVKYKDDKNEKSGPVPQGNELVGSITNAKLSCENGYAATKDERETCKQMDIPKEKAQRYAGLDRRADIAFGGLNYDSKAHETAAMNYCRNLILNREMEIPDPVTGLKSVDHARKERFMTSELVAASVARSVCDEAVRARRVTRGYGNTLDPAENNFYRVFNFVGFRPVDADPKTQWPDTDGLSYASKYMYNPKQAPSLLQREMKQVAEMLDPTMVNGTGVQLPPLLINTLQAKAVATSQNFQRLRYMETELLIEAALLARKVVKRDN